MNRGKCRYWMIGLVVADLARLGCLADDFSSTNREALKHFWRVAEERQRPVTVLSFGDSMADSWRSPTYYLMLKLEDRLGGVGVALNNYQNRAAYQLLNGATAQVATEIWFSTYLSLPPGGGGWWLSLNPVAGQLCDEAGIFYVRHPQGGDFALSVSTNGAPWATNLILDGYSPTPVGCYTNLHLALDRHRLRVDSLSGTNYVIGPQYLQAHTNGVNVAFLDYGGIALWQVTNVPAAIRDPIFAALKPDLLVWHMKEEALPLAAWLNECENWWTNACPDCDVLYLGTPWTLYDDTDTRTRDQNQVVRSVAVSRGRAYVDLMQPGINYGWLVTNGLISNDGVHPTNEGGQWGANILWNDMNFFALGLPRELSLALTNGLAQVGFATAPGATYSLQSSTNLQTWWDELTVPGTGSYQSTNLIPTQPQGYYRLRLTR